MTSSPLTVQQTTTTALQTIIGSLLERAEQAHQRMADPNDADALHDFRVAVRRIKSCFDAYGQRISGSREKKIKKGLRGLIQDTNDNRDWEVHLAWIEKALQHRPLAQLQRQGYRLMRDKLRNVSGNGSRGAEQTISAAFTHVQQLINKPSEESDSIPFTQSTQEVIDQLTAKLSTRLALIHSIKDHEAGHRARLTAKRLRYVIEPLRDSSIGARKVVNRLKVLQDLLGELRDLQTLEADIADAIKISAVDWSETLIRTGKTAKTLAGIKKHPIEMTECYALAAALRGVVKSQNKIFAQLELKWLGGNADKLLAHIDQMKQGLPNSLPREPIPTAPAA